MSNFLTPEEKRALRLLHKHSNRRNADKIKALLMLDSGHPYSFIAEVLLMEDSTIWRWHEVYKTSGVEGLLADNFTGGLSYLTPEQQTCLVEHLKSNVYLTAKEICNLVEEKFAVEYTPKGMTELLKRLGFVYKKPKHIPGKADIEKQEKFIKEYRKLKKNLAKHDKIYFVDGVHPLHNSQPAYGWIKKGTQMVLKSNTGRERININGAYNIEDHTAIIQETDTINAQSTIKLLQEILRKQPVGLICLILDNARYYSNDIVKRFVAKHPRIRLMFLPPYSPNLNIIERLWKFFKKTIIYNTYYEKFAVFREECLNFFKNLGDYREKLETLMTDNFQLIQA